MHTLYILIGSLLALFPASLFAAFETQGFTSWDASSWAFQCEATCFILLWAPSGGLLEIDAHIEGQGMIAYGYLIDNTITPIGSENLWNDISIRSELSLHPQFALLRTKPLVVLIQGKTHWVFSQLSFRNVTFSEKITLRWNEFWTLRPFGPATINLLYGPFMGGKSANNVFYTIFIIGVFLIVFFIKKEKRPLTVAILALSLWCIYDLRMSAEIMKTYTSDITSLSQSWVWFRDRWDFYQFIDFAKESLEKRWVKKDVPVSFYTDNSWPFPDSARYFLYPHALLKNAPSDTLLVYAYSDIALTASGLTLSGIFMGTGVIEPFSSSAFIFYRR